MKTGKLHLLIATLAILFSVLACTQKKEDNVNKFEFNYQVKVPQQELGKIVELWIPLPKSNELQTIEAIDVDSPMKFEAYNDKQYDNKFIYIKGSALSKALNVKVKIRASRKERVGAVNADINNTAFYLKENSKVIVTDDIKKETEEVVTGLSDKVAKANAIYNHIVESVKYDKTGKGWGNGDVLWVCDERRGNCSDFHSLFIAMCRSINIPARFTIGFPFPENTDGKETIIKGYHCWAEFFIDGKGWIAVDASEAFKHPEKKDYLFSNLDNNRIAFTLGRDIKLLPGDDAPQLNFFIYPYCRVNGEEIKLEKRFTYKKL